MYAYVARYIFLLFFVEQFIYLCIWCSDGTTIIPFPRRLSCAQCSVYLLTCVVAGNRAYLTIRTVRVYERSRDQKKKKSQIVSTGYRAHSCSELMKSNAHTHTDDAAALEQLNFNNNNKITTFKWRWWFEKRIIRRKEGKMKGKKSSKKENENYYFVLLLFVSLTLVYLFRHTSDFYVATNYSARPTDTNMFSFILNSKQEYAELRVWILWRNSREELRAIGKPWMESLNWGPLKVGVRGNNAGAGPNEGQSSPYFQPLGGSSTNFLSKVSCPRGKNFIPRFLLEFSAVSLYSTFTWWREPLLSYLPHFLFCMYENV